VREIRVGGARAEGLGPGFYVQPTLFTHAKSTMRVAREEIFGPVLTALPFENEAEAVKIANDTPYGLAAYIWTADSGRALRMAHAVDAGMVWVNSENNRHLPTPFGGMKASGIGRDGGDYSFDFYMETKNICIAHGTHPCAEAGSDSAPEGDPVSAQLDRLKGSIPPLVTPFHHGEVDYEAYARLVAFQIKNGSHGILVNGTTAEPSTLSVEERNRLVDIAVQVAAGKVPVVAATGSQSLRETRELTEHAAKAGVDALLIVTPYYIRPPQRGLIAYYLELASLTDLPWMVYHIPGRAAVNVTIDTLKELRAKSPQLRRYEARGE
jgi:delta 1-pyrroline-5-carboxylate dehydrogenase